MPISFFPSRDVAPRYAVFGKLPHSADFVRLGQSSHPAVQEFDGVIARSISYCGRRQTWDESRALRAEASCFQFTTHDRRWCFLGVLQPSLDAAGRFYPLAAGIILPAHAVAPYGPELAVANEPFFADLRQAVAIAIRAGDLPACQRCLASWSAENPGAQDDFALARQLLARHLARTPAFRLQALLGESFSGYSPDADSLTDTLLAFIFCAALLRREGDRATKQVLCLPLSNGQGEGALDVAAWLALYRAASGSRGYPDFIIHGTGSGSLMLAPGRLGERCLGPFWGISPDMTDAAVRETPWRQHPGWARSAAALSRCVQNPGTDLASILTTVGTVAGYAK
jgi:type VI secretion system protein ImpM